MLVAGNMIGTGLFLLPVHLASVGGIAVFGWLVATAGAAALGLVFAKLGELDPQEGGPYAYARDFLGPYVGFQTNYVYWFGNWIGNIAMPWRRWLLAEFIPPIASPASVFATAQDLGLTPRHILGRASSGLSRPDHEPRLSRSWASRSSAGSGFSRRRFSTAGTSAVVPRFTRFRAPLRSRSGPSWASRARPFPLA
jgi:hypothetical protein